MNINAAFDWKCQPAAEKFILDVIERATMANSAIAQLEQDLLTQTSTRLLDWLDHVVVEDTASNRSQLEVAGYVPDTEKNVFHHPGAQLPRVFLNDSPVGLAVSVDHIDDFIMAHGGGDFLIKGSLFGNYRKCWFKTEEGVALWVVERRGSMTFKPTQEGDDQLQKYHHAIEKWESRPRSLEHEEQDMNQAIQIARQLVESIGRDRAAWTVLEVERRYWQSRNMAGQTQKNRQDRLGMGWANHDHHTFRSSRKLFHKLVQLFEILGFHARERYYTGKEAGWGAQIMENPNCRLVLFLDVDLGPEEILIDFAHQPLPELDKLGTIGLWCALHGDSIGHAGMHHLEAQFMFDQLQEDLDGRGIKMMNPFSNFPFLKQAFTAGETWKVSPKRVLALVDNKKITEEQAEKFLEQGAVGSHLENLQRREGFKGFNQKNVSIIIKETDPRKLSK